MNIVYVNFTIRKEGEDKCMLIEEHIPKDKGIDNTFALLQEGYLFIRNRVDRYQSNLFETHLFGQKVICMTGEEAAKLFYNEELFQRNGAAPKRIQKPCLVKMQFRLWMMKSIFIESTFLCH